MLVKLVVGMVLFKRYWYLRKIILRKGRGGEFGIWYFLEIGLKCLLVLVNILRFFLKIFIKGWKLKKVILFV